MFDLAKRDKPNPRLGANWISQLFFAWIVPLLYKGSRQGLSEEDMPDCLPDDQSQQLGDKLERYWQTEMEQAQRRKRSPKLRTAVWKAFWPLAVTDGIIYFIYIMLKSLIPLILAQLLIVMESRSSMAGVTQLGVAGESLNATSNGTEQLIETQTNEIVARAIDDCGWWVWLHQLWHNLYWLGALLVGSTLIGCFINHHVNQRLTRMGVKIRIACCSLIFRKTTHLSLSTAGDISVGYIVNLISNDVNRFDIGFLFIHNLWILPIQTLLIGYLIWLRLRYAAIIGVVALLLQTIPVQLCLSKWTVRLRKRIAQCTDNRVSKMHELIQGMQVIKMYAWEQSFAAVVKAARRLEIQVTRRAAYLRSFYLSSMILPERLTLFITIVAAVQLDMPVSSDLIFSIANLYHVFQLVAGIFCPMAISFAAEAFASFSRVEQFLLLPEKRSINAGKVDDQQNAIELRNVSARWSLQPATNTATTESEEMLPLKPINEPSALTLTDVTLSIPKGKLCAIVGAVGAGKSSLCHALLQELEISHGSISIEGELSYAAQQSWLFPLTVRENIIFGQPSDNARYQQVVEACALLSDFEQLQLGDSTLVGEGGASLSGGQQARVNLARAVYKQASVYLFDDPLSAVDARVGRQLFDRVIGPHATLLAGCTRLLITHQIQYLHEADLIVLVENGRIVASGDWQAMRHMVAGKSWGADSTTDTLAERIGDQPSQKDNNTEQSEEKRPQNGCTASKTNGEESSQLEAEQQTQGTVKASVWWQYFHAGNSVAGLLFIALILIVSQIICSGADYFVNVYTRIISMSSQHQETWLTENACLVVYSVLISAAIVMIILRCYLFLKTCMHASKVLHERMFARILCATMSFFDANPSGRILNRFSKDMGAMDESLPRFMSEFTHLALVMLGVLVVICILNPMLLAAVAAVMLVDYWIIKLYLRASQDLKRREAIRRSPVFSHVSACLSGLATIRVRRLEKTMALEFDKLQDRHSAAYHLTLSSNNALGLWLDCANCCILFNSVTFCFIIFNSDTYSGNVGLAITQAMMLTGMVQYGLRQLGEAFQQMTSVERILDYTKLKSIENNKDKECPMDWPQRGEIEFQRVSYKYRNAGIKVLKNLSFYVAPTWKVGIVGRTGAGKTSLISTIFRLYDIEGQILIDQKNCGRIDLHKLRSSISVIPQEPVLFRGSIRYNLDPFDIYRNEDHRLYEALEKVGLRGVFDLHMDVAESGSNLSVGQRQLICLARALLRENKILLLDEATANVDERTDFNIQNAIRTHFAHCTVLTIAHRLRTVMDSDRILVLDAGHIMEFDQPLKLLQKPNGYLKRMVDATGEGARELYEKAEIAYQKQ